MAKIIRGKVGALGTDTFDSSLRAKIFLSRGIAYELVGVCVAAGKQ